MARTVADIFNRILAEKAATPELAGLTSTSKLSVWRSWAYVTAVCLWLHEQIFVEHEKEVKRLIDEEEPHHPAWYAKYAKLFQYGFTPVAGKHYYDNTGIPTATIEASKVVKYASAVEIPKGLMIKVSGESGGDLLPLTTLQLDAFKEYMQKHVKDAGVKLYFKNLPADTLRLHLKIYYNALVLDSTGKRLDGTNNTPVQQSIRNYLKNLIDFNGYYVNAALIDELQKVDGVKVPHLVLAESRYGALPFTQIVVQRQPDAGWMRIADADLTLEFIPYELL